VPKKSVKKKKATKVAWLTLAKSGRIPSADGTWIAAERVKDSVAHDFQHGYHIK